MNSPCIIRYFRIDLLAATDKVRASLTNWIADNTGHDPMAIATSANKETVKRAQAKYGVEGTASRADEILGIAAKLLQDSGVRKFVVAGRRNIRSGHECNRYRSGRSCAF